MNMGDTLLVAEGHSDFVEAVGQVGEHEGVDVGESVEIDEYLILHLININHISFSRKSSLEIKLSSGSTI